MACCAIEVLGWITLVTLVAKLLHNVCHFVYTTFLGSLLGRNIDVAKCGPWAVVTGATDGIGKEFANKMAAAGLNVVLISRTPAKLKAVTDELKSQFSTVQFKTIAADFTEGQSIYPKIQAELAGLKIGILINNVGMLTNHGQRFDTIDEANVRGIINCNIMSMARMCHIVLPQMVRRKSGVIINIGSIASTLPTPLLTIYGATKAFVNKFSQDLAAEVRPLGVTVQTVHPGYVLTNMAPMEKSPLVGATPETYVAATLRTLGLEDRTGAYWAHKIQLCILDAVNFFVPRRSMEPHIMKNIQMELEETRKYLTNKKKSK